MEAWQEDQHWLSSVSNFPSTDQEGAKRSVVKLHWIWQRNCFCCFLYFSFMLTLKTVVSSSWIQILWTFGFLDVELAHCLLQPWLSCCLFFVQQRLSCGWESPAEAGFPKSFQQMLLGPIISENNKKSTLWTIKTSTHDDSNIISYEWNRNMACQKFIFFFKNRILSEATGSLERGGWANVDRLLVVMVMGEQLKAPAGPRPLFSPMPSNHRMCLSALKIYFGQNPKNTHVSPWSGSPIHKTQEGRGT